MTFDLDDSSYGDDPYADIISKLQDLNNKRDYKGAIAFIEELSDEYRKDNAIIGCLASAYMALGEYKKAEEALKDVDFSESTENIELYHYTLASLKMLEGDEVLAMLEAKRTLKLLPSKAGMIEHMFNLLHSASESLCKKKKRGFPKHRKYGEANYRHIEERLEEYFAFPPSVTYSSKQADADSDVKIITRSQMNRYGVTTIYTCGLSKYSSNTSRFIKKAGFERQEVMIEFPSSWNEFSSNEKERMLYRDMIHIVEVIVALIASGQPVFWSSTFSTEPIFSPESPFKGGAIIYPSNLIELETIEGDDINLHQIYLLKEEDVEFISNNAIQSFMALLNQEEDFVIDLNDKYFDVYENYVVEHDRPHNLPWNAFDSAEIHMESIKNQGLKKEDSYKHMAYYLRWIVENGLASDLLKNLLKNAGGNYFYLVESLSGILTYDLLSQRGEAFTRCYYSFYKPGKSFFSDMLEMARGFNPNAKDDPELYLILPYSDIFYAVARHVTSLFWKSFKKTEKRRDMMKPINIPERKKLVFLNEEILLNGSRIMYAYREKPVDRSDSGWRLNNIMEQIDDAGSTAMPISELSYIEPRLDRILDASVGSHFFFVAPEGKFINISKPRERKEPDFGFTSYSIDVQDVHIRMMEKSDAFFFQKKANLILDPKFIKRFNPNPESTVCESIEMAKENAMLDGFDWNEDIVGNIEGEDDHTLLSELFGPLAEGTLEKGKNILDYISPVEDFKDYARLKNTLMFLEKKFGLRGQIALTDRIILTLDKPLREKEALMAATVIYSYAPYDRDDKIGEITSRLIKHKVASIII